MLLLPHWVGHDWFGEISAFEPWVAGRGGGGGGRWGVIGPQDGNVWIASMNMLSLSDH